MMLNVVDRLALPVMQTFLQGLNMQGLVVLYSWLIEEAVSRLKNKRGW